METHAFGFRLRANAPEGQKRFPISIQMRSPQCAAGPAGAAGRKIYNQTIDEIRWREEDIHEETRNVEAFRSCCRGRRHRRRRNPRPVLAQDQKKMVTVVKIAGIPWFNALENGVKKAGTEFGIDSSVVAGQSQSASR